MIQVYTQNQSLVSVLPLHVLANGKYSNVPVISAYGRLGVLTSVLWPSNNLAVYSPVNLPAAFTVSRFFWGNGATTTGNADVGLYDASGKLLINTGSTSRAASGSIIQYASVTAQTFPAGFYYLAMVLGSSSGNIQGSALTNTLYGQAAGLLQEALGSVALPATMTPVEYTAATAWNYGFTQSATL